MSHLPRRSREQGAEFETTWSDRAAKKFIRELKRSSFGLLAFEVVSEGALQVLAVDFLDEIELGDVNAAHRAAGDLC